MEGMWAWLNTNGCSKKKKKEEKTTKKVNHFRALKELCGPHTSARELGEHASENAAVKSISLGGNILGEKQRE